MIDPLFWETLWLTFKLAITTTTILFVIGIPIAALLGTNQFRGKPILDALISMPLVLPPSVLGYYLLVAYSPDNFPGNLLKEWFDVQLAFSYEGIVIGSVIFSLPFMISPIQSGLQNLPSSLSEACATLGKNKWTTLYKVLLPNIKPSLLTAGVLTFAHTIGEFGVVLMIGGNLQGRTRVASIAIYDELQDLHPEIANRYALILFAVTFTLLIAINLINRKQSVWKPF